jgi:four helix bundle protein
MQDFRELKVWQSAHRTTREIYKLTGRFPKEEMYGLTSQMRRAAYSIPSNIAEGRGGGSDLVFRRHLNNAMGSAFELEYFLILARDLGYCDEQKQNELVDRVTEVRRMLNSFISTLGEGLARPPTSRKSKIPGSQG